LGAALARGHLDQERNAAFLPAVHRDVDGVETFLVELQLLDVHDEIAGKENGFLMATYKQLGARGVHRISKAINEAEDRGLILVEHGYRKSLNESSPNIFQLTFLKVKAINEHGVVYYHAPENQWKRYKKK